MVKIRIDKIECEVPEGTTILEVSKMVGLHIPSLCHKDDLPYHSSCMVCIVKNNKTNHFIPSCCAIVQDEMDIDASGDEVIALRKEALELLLSEHRAECEAPCKIVCPAELNIPVMNRLIAKGDIKASGEIAFLEMGFPEIMCGLCPAYCENACRRGKIDTPVSIRNLIKNSTANPTLDLRKINSLEKKQNKIAVVGSGPSGLSIAFHLAKSGNKCVIYEKENRPGGSLLKEVSENRLPEDVLNKEIQQLIDFGVEMKLDISVNEEMLINEISGNYDQIILAVGNVRILDMLSNTKDYLISAGDTYLINGKYVFVSGYGSKHEKPIVKIMGDGKKTAEAFEAFIAGGMTAGKTKRFNSSIGKLYENEFEEWLKECTVDVERFKVFSGSNEASEEANSCMHCDCRASESCKLRKLAEEFSIKDPRGKLVYSPIRKKINFKTGLIFENAKCIKCGLCVRICNDTVDDPGLCFIGRGFGSIVSEPLTEEFGNILKTKTEECVEACPTGALSLIN